MDPIMDVIKNSEEPEWLEKRIVGELRLWQIMFICLAGVTSLNRLQSLPKSITCFNYGEGMPQGSICKDKTITRYAVVMICCCFRFRIPRTKQQIEADYKRRKITTKFRHQLETIQDSKMDTISLKDALELLHEKTHTMEGENQSGSQPSSIISPQQSSLEASFQPESGQKPDPQSSGLIFLKFATKVAQLSKLGQPKSPTSPTSSDNKMDF